MDQLAALAGMAAAAFLAATLLPAQSEAVFVGLVATRAAEPLALFLIASFANTAGSLVNWWLGRLVADRGIERLPAWARPEEAGLARARGLFARWGWAAVLLCWVPLIGDPLTFVAGLMRYRLALFLPLVAFAKTARYAALWAGWAALA